MTSHGFFDGDTQKMALPGLLFNDSNDAACEDHLFWDYIFAALTPPAGVELTVLPDLRTPTC